MTICEEMVYKVMLENRRELTVNELTELVNRTYKNRWTRRNVKCFLKRLIKSGEVKRRRYQWNWYYEVKEEA